MDKDKVLKQLRKTDKAASDELAVMLFGDKIEKKQKWINLLKNDLFKREVTRDFDAMRQ